MFNTDFQRRTEVYRQHITVIVRVSYLNNFDGTPTFSNFW